MLLPFCRTESLLSGSSDPIWLLNIHPSITANEKPTNLRSSLQTHTHVQLLKWRRMWNPWITETNIKCDSGASNPPKSHLVKNEPCHPFQLHLEWMSNIRISQQYQGFFIAAPAPITIPTYLRVREKLSACRYYAHIRKALWLAEFTTLKRFTWKKKKHVL